MHITWLDQEKLCDMYSSTIASTIVAGRGEPITTSTTSLTQLLWVHFVSNLGFAFSLNHNGQDDIMLVRCLSTWFGVENFCMAHLTLAHALTNFHISQFGYWNLLKAYMIRIRYTYCFSTRYFVIIQYLAVHSCNKTGDVTISLSESNFWIIIS